MGVGNDPHNFYDKIRSSGFKRRELVLVNDRQYRKLMPELLLVSLHFLWLRSLDHRVS